MLHCIQIWAELPAAKGDGMAFDELTEIVLDDNPRHGVCEVLFPYAVRAFVTAEGAAALLNPGSEQSALLHTTDLLGKLETLEIERA